LMQVMTSVHDDKYEAFGGKFAAFDPVTNLRVGVQVLAECVSRAGGSVELGLKYYVGAANLPDDGGYAERVFFEQNQLKLVASGQAVPLNVAFSRSPAMASNAAPAAAMAVAGGALASKAQAQPGARETLHTALPASPSQTALTPAAHAAPGTVMAPAVGAALAANLSAPAPAVQTAPASTATAAATTSTPGDKTSAAGAALAAVQAAPPTSSPAAQHAAPVMPAAGNTKVAAVVDAVR
ncbi:MAG: hypothetical protein ACK57J_02010, partial [Rubrivivax sp.]